MLIESIGHGKRILAQMHPIRMYAKEVDRFNAMHESIKEFEFKNEEHRAKLTAYVGIKADCKLDRFFK